VSIGRRLTVAFASVAGIIALGAGIGSWEFATILSQTKRLAAVGDQALALYRVRADVGEIQRRLETLAKAQEPPSIFDSSSQLLRQELLRDVDQTLAYFRVTGTPVPATLDALRDAITGQLDAMQGLAEVKDWTAVQLRLDNQVDGILDDIGRMVDYVDLELTDRRMHLLAEVESARKQSRNTLALTALLSLVTSLALGWYVIRSIVTPLSQLRGAAHQFARGDFNIAPDFKSNDELGEVKDAFLVAARELHQYYLALQRSNQDLEQFAYAASHDLQEPVRTISLFSAMLRTRHGDSLPPEAKEYVRHVVDSAARMQELITGILHYSRLGGSSNDQEEHVETEEVVTTVLQNLQASIEQTNAVIEHDKMPAVKGSKLQLVQLFQNLVSNAIKYRRENEVPRIYISARHEAALWKFCVADNGIGIDPRYHSRVFGIFKQLNRGERGGAGVGLAISKRIVERHGGTISVESKAGEGCRFFFTLQPAEEKVAVHDSAMIPASQTRT
jgi:signal transduction histidine kinase